MKIKIEYKEINNKILVTNLIAFKKDELPIGYIELYKDFIFLNKHDISLLHSHEDCRQKRMMGKGTIKIPDELLKINKLYEYKYFVETLKLINTKSKQLKEYNILYNKQTKTIEI